MGTKISNLSSQLGTNTESTDILYTVDLSEASDVDKGKKITIHELGIAINELMYEGFRMKDIDGSNYLKHKWNEDATADRSILWSVNGQTRQITIGGTLTVESSSTIDQDLTKDAVVEFAGVKVGANQVVGAQSAAVADGPIASTGTIAYTGIDNLQAGNVYAQSNDLNNLRIAHEELRTRYNSLKDIVNDLLAKTRTHGLIAT